MTAQGGAVWLQLGVAAQSAAVPAAVPAAVLAAAVLGATVAWPAVACMIRSRKRMLGSIGTP